MSTKEQIAKILREIKPTKDLLDITNIIEGGYLDSFELMLLISKLTETFNIEIEIDEIKPENFNSPQAIADMVERIKGRRSE